MGKMTAGGEWMVRWQEWNDNYTKSEHVWVSANYDTEDVARVKFKEKCHNAIGIVELQHGSNLVDSFPSTAQ